MPIKYHIDLDQNLIMEVWTGEIQADDLAEYWKRYLGDPDVLSIRRTIVDVRQAIIRFKGSDMDLLIQTIVQPILAGRNWRTAIVVEQPVQYGISRQYQVFAERFSKDAIFHSIEEARRWICNLDPTK